MARVTGWQQRRATMPEHVASHVGRMNEICDEAAVRFRAMFGDVDSVAYGQLRSLVNEWPGRRPRPGYAVQR